MVRPLVIDRTQKRAVRHLVAFAESAGNWYRPTRDEWVPGDREEYCLHLNTYCCVYTHTVIGSTHYRHLSISVPSDNFPHPTAVYTIAHMFGFAGAKMTDEIAVEPGEEWLLNVNKEEHCIVIAEKLRDDEVLPEENV